MRTPTNAETVELLEEMRSLMELNGENPFKVRAFEKAANVLSERDDVVARARAGTLTEIAGIGKGISEVLVEFIVHGKTTERDELKKALPPGLVELTSIPGLGPKKARVLIDELGIHSIAELEYACSENRLTKLKGFGEKVQEKIIQGIRFQKANQGRARIDEAFPHAERALAALTEAAGECRVSETGELRRRMETLSRLEFLVELPESGDKAFRSKIEKAAKTFADENKASLPIALDYAAGETFGYELARTTASEASWKALECDKPLAARDEEAFFSKLGLEWIPPETRETGEEVRLARAGKLGAILPWNGVRGIFHNHTTRSDGVATLEQMVREASRLGYEYIGISDHSQSAFYAQGLKPDTLLTQEREIREVQEKYPDIRIFWGIESDILADGSLDYDAKILERFDFVVASIHSRFQMDRHTMTERILEAIRNPCTRFLGHATGRLLLGRHGYDVEMERIIEEAARHDVAIEINANPARLDIDWRWGPELRKRKTLVSVNPDAHSTEGLRDTLYGIAMARKALMPTSQVVNSRSADEVARWLRRA
jgi:DNA polymerase (family 10)